LPPGPAFQLPQSLVSHGDIRYEASSWSAGVQGFPTCRYYLCRLGRRLTALAHSAPSQLSPIGALVHPGVPCCCPRAQLHPAGPLKNWASSLLQGTLYTIDMPNSTIALSNGEAASAVGSKRNPPHSLCLPACAVCVISDALPLMHPPAPCPRLNPLHLAYPPTLCRSALLRHGGSAQGQPSASLGPGL
jgi:hypothetical protein